MKNNFSPDNNERTEVNYALTDYDTEDGLYIDENDKYELSLLTEKERNRILFERHNKVMQHNDTQILERKYQEIGKSKVVDEPKEIVSESPETPFTFENMKRIILKRDFIAKNVYKPFLHKIVGNFVRVQIYGDYQIAKITGLSRAKVYIITAGRRHFKTDRIIEVFVNGEVRKAVQICYVSNSEILESEFEKWRILNKNFNFKNAEREYSKLVRVMEKSLSDEDSVLMHGERRKFIYGSKNIIQKKIQLIREREEALEKDKFEEAEKLQREIDAISEEVGKKRKVDPFVEISEKNRKINKQMFGSEFGKP